MRKTPQNTRHVTPRGLSNVVIVKIYKLQVLTFVERSQFVLVKNGKSGRERKKSGGDPQPLSADPKNFIMASALVNGLLVQGLPDENDNSTHTKEQIYMNGTATDTSDLLKSTENSVSKRCLLYVSYRCIPKPNVF